MASSMAVSAGYNLMYTVTGAKKENDAYTVDEGAEQVVFETEIKDEYSTKTRVSSAEALR